MSDNQNNRRGRRIHVQGSDPGWAGGTPSRPPLPGASPPDREVPLPGPAADDLEHAALSARLAKAESETQERIRQLVRRGDDLRESFDRVKGVELEAAGASVAAARETTQTARRLALEHLARRHASEVEELSGAVSSAASALAPGAAGLTWSEDWPGESPDYPARYSRFGTLALAGGPTVAAVAPFVGSSGWFLTGDRDSVDGLVLSTLARVVAQSPLKRLCVTVFDPQARGLLGAFSGLRDAVGSAFSAPSVDAQSFTERLDHALEVMGRDSELVVAAGAVDLVDQWRSSATPQGVLQVVVVLDYPHAVTEAAQSQLLRIAAAQSPARPVLLVAADSAAKAREGVRVADLQGSLVTLTADEGTWQAPGHLASSIVSDDGPPPPGAVHRIVAEAAERAHDDTGPVIPLAELIGDDLENPWRHSAQESLDLPFGRSDRGLLQLSLRTENPPHPNVLVGGAVGQGKSNLLLDIVYGLAARYGPEELELHLLDFKEGLEFSRFGPDDAGRGWLPHVRTLSLESDQHFGLAVLRHFEEQLGARADLFKGARVTSINAYRAAGAALPRMLLVVDEFHKLIIGDNPIADEALEILERLARTGRAYGIHLLLASQTTSGVPALALKGDAIFGQFPLRISLKNTASESQMILSSGNKAAADLTYRGEVVFNRNYGSADDNGNQVGIAAFARPEEMSQLQGRLWDLRHDEPPLVFLGKEYAAWPSRPVERRSEGLVVWLGRPMSVSDAPRTHHLDADSDQGVVVLGQDRAATRAALWSIAVTALEGLTGGHIVVLDGEGDEANTWVDRLSRLAEVKGVGVRRVGRDLAAAYLRHEMALRVGNRQAQEPVLLLGLSVQRMRDLEAVDPDASDFDFSLEETGTGRSVLRTIAKDGAKNHVFLAASWNNLRTMEADLGAYGAGVGVFVTAGLGLDDLRSIAGPHVRAVDGSPRLGVYAPHGAAEGIEVLVPYDPGGPLSPAES